MNPYRTYQKILVMSTREATLRSEAIGWDLVEDPGRVKPGPIGLTPSDKEASQTFDCVLRAMSKGWRLLGPPERNKDGTASWWLEKDG